MATVNRIVINDNGGSKTITPAEWKALPLTKRVQLLSAKVMFYAGQQTVDPKEAMAQLR